MFANPNVVLRISHYISKFAENCFAEKVSYTY